jgi:hypothetical protein
LGMHFTLPIGAGSVFALAFASPTRLFVGTTAGQVFRADRAGNTWTATRLDDVAAGPIGLSGLVTDVAIDWADPTRSSIYLTFGGVGDPRRVWRFDGNRWEARSGTAPSSNLLNVEHNVVVVDPKAPSNVYVGGEWLARCARFRSPHECDAALASRGDSWAGDIRDTSRLKAATDG